MVYSVRMGNSEDTVAPGVDSIPYAIQPDSAPTTTEASGPQIVPITIMVSAEVEKVETGYVAIFAGCNVRAFGATAEVATANLKFEMESAILGVPGSEIEITMTCAQATEVEQPNG
jgi:hypothetical protein